MPGINVQVDGLANLSLSALIKDLVQMQTISMAYFYVHASTAFRV